MDVVFEALKEKLNSFISTSLELRHVRCCIVNARNDEFCAPETNTFLPPPPPPSASGDIEPPAGRGGGERRACDCVSVFSVADDGPSTETRLHQSEPLTSPRDKWILAPGGRRHESAACHRENLEKSWD